MNSQHTNSPIYITIDGDDIGSQLAQAYLNDDEARLVEIDRHLQYSVRTLGELLAGQGYHIVACGADGITARKSNVEFPDLMAEIRRTVHPFTFSAGAGFSLRASFVALKYAKSCQKDKLCFFDQHTFELYE